MKNDTVKTRLPIQKGLMDLILFNICKKFENQPYLESMYITAFLLFYHGLMRVGELAESPHAVKAVNVHESKSSTKILLILYSSKTHGKESLPQQIKIIGKKLLEVQDTDGKPIKAALKKSQVGSFCPVEWTKSYISLRDPILDEEEQFLVFHDGSKVKPTHLRNLLREIIKTDLNLNAKLYDTHSFRIGRATDLFKHGMPIEDIKQLGRWKSNAVYKYLRQC